MGWSLRLNEAAGMKTPPKAVKKIKKPPKTKKLANSKTLIGIVTVNDISPI